MPFDQAREMSSNRRDQRPARVGRRSVAVDPDFSWSDTPDDRHSLAHRRHPAREADDWGLTGDDDWAVAREQPPERALAERDRARRERSGRAARDGFAGDGLEEDHSRAGSRARDEAAAGHYRDEHRSAYDWAREFDNEFGAADAAEVRARRIEPQRTGSAQAAPERSKPDVPVQTHSRDDVPAETRSRHDIPAETQPPPDVPPQAQPSHREDAGASPDPRASDGATDNIWEQRPSATGQRRTVLITGRGAEYGRSSSRRGWEASLPVHERSGFKPDRLALWAVLLGIILLLVATTSSHAAVLATHLAH